MRQRPSDLCRRVEPDAVDGASLCPFDLAEVVTNLRQERYQPKPAGTLRATLDVGCGAARSSTTSLRPMLPVGVRKHLQQIRLSGWERIRVPALAGRRQRRHADASSAMALAAEERRHRADPVHLVLARRRAELRS